MKLSYLLHRTQVVDILLFGRHEADSDVLQGDIPVLERRVAARELEVLIDEDIRGFKRQKMAFLSPESSGLFFKESWRNTHPPVRRVDVRVPIDRVDEGFVPVRHFCADKIAVG